VAKFLSVETPSSLDEEGACNKMGAENGCAWLAWVCLEGKVAAESSLLNNTKNFVSRDKPSEEHLESILPVIEL